MGRWSGFSDKATEPLGLILAGIGICGQYELTYMSKRVGKPPTILVGGKGTKVYRKRRPRRENCENINYVLVIILHYLRKGGQANLRNVHVLEPTTPLAQAARHVRIVDS